MYDSILSSKFNLMVATLESSSMGKEYDMVPSVDVVTQKLPQRSKMYQLGTGISDDGVHEFEISFYREQSEPFNMAERDAIAKWLVGNYRFKPLRFIQDDMRSVYYNCYFKDLKHVTFGNMTYGFTATAVCDAPFAWNNPITVKKENAVGNNGVYPLKTVLKILNTTSEHNLVLPTMIEVQLAPFSSGFSMYNSKTKDRFSFSDLPVGTKVQIDDLHCIVNANNPTHIIVDNFSGDFLRLGSGLNEITVEGEITSVKIVYQCGKKIG